MKIILFIIFNLQLYVAIGQVTLTEENELFENHINQIVDSNKTVPVRFEIYHKSTLSENIEVKWNSEKILIRQSSPEYDPPLEQQSFEEFRYVPGYFIAKEDSANIVVTERPGKVTISKFHNDTMIFKKDLTYNSEGSFLYMENIGYGSDFIQVTECSTHVLKDGAIEGTISIYHKMNGNIMMPMIANFKETITKKTEDKQYIDISYYMNVAGKKVNSPKKTLVKTFDKSGRVTEIFYPDVKKTLKVFYD